MPKFYKQNKKKINPRYFLNESSTVDKETELDAKRDAQKLVDSGMDWDEAKKLGFYQSVMDENGNLTDYGMMVDQLASDMKTSDPKVFDKEVKSIKNKYKKIDQIFSQNESIMESWRKFKKKTIEEQFDVDPDREADERAFRAGGDNPFRQKAEGDTEELVQKLLTVMRVPTNFCAENPDHDDCFSEDFLKNMLQNFQSEWPEEVEDEEDLARYLCGPEARDTEWAWVASEASQLYVQLGEEGKL